MLDFSQNRYKELWFRHPVLEDASFDTFERDHANPLHKGSYPYEWPVNCSLFRDTVSGNLYAYVSQYSRGYWNTPIRCIAYRSQDQGASWEYIGVVLEGAVPSIKADGPVVKIINFRHQTGDSVISQDIVLYSDSPRIDFMTSVDWKETGEADKDAPTLKACFIPDISM